MDTEQRLLDSLDAQQRAAVTAARGPVCVLAGAGTGKTRTITHRIAYLVARGHISAGQVLAVTFTKRAAGEMRTRLRALGVSGAQAVTFHAAALRQLRYFWPKAVGDQPWDLLDAKIRFVGQAAHRAGAPTDAESLRDLAGEIEWAKASLIAPEQYSSVVAQNHREPPIAADKVAAVYRGYEQVKAKASMLDFDDLLLNTAAILEENSAIATEFRDRYRCFVVDEYQDITPLQQRVLDAWLGARDDLTVVGDANQTIYSFAGASPRPLLNFSRRFPQASTIRLERDYRSTPQVVELANQVIGAAADRPAGSRLTLIGQRSDGPQPEFTEFPDEPAEAAAIAARIRLLRDQGVPASEIAVLFRVNAQSEVYEQALTDAGIPYQVRGGERFFSRPEVRQAITVLRTATGTPYTEDLPAAVRVLLEPLGLTQQPPAGGATRDRWESLLALVELAEEFAATVAGADLRQYVTELDIRAEAQHPPLIDGVTLASLHAAKGLEWDAVFLAGLTEGTLPIKHADKDPSAIEEERRLFYVGITRAREQLWLSWSLTRTPGSRQQRRHSRFLHGVLPEDHPAARIAKASNRDTHASRKLACRVCGSALIGTAAVKLGRCASCPSTMDEDLFLRLKEWRLGRAKELKLPAFVVFTDATLVAIAEQHPTEVGSLAAIPGIGKTKLDQFGSDVLAIVRGERSETEVCAIEE